MRIESELERVGGFETSLGWGMKRPKMKSMNENKKGKRLQEGKRGG